MLVALSNSASRKDEYKALPKINWGALEETKNFLFLNNSLCNTTKLYEFENELIYLPHFSKKTLGLFIYLFIILLESRMFL